MGIIIPKDVPGARIVSPKGQHRCIRLQVLETGACKAGKFSAAGGSGCS